VTHLLTPWRALPLILVTLLATAGCGSGEDSADTVDAASATDASATDAAAADEMFDTDYEQVCRDTGQPRAAEYVAGPGVHPILVLTSDDGTDFMGASPTLPEGWAATFPDLEQTQLVGCIVRTAATPAELCEGYEDDDTGAQWSVQTHDVTYEYTVRNARTAEVLGRSTFEVPAGQCPMFSMHSADDPDPDPYYPSISDGEAELFVRPFVTGS
jgi:hypothetical protein